MPLGGKGRVRATKSLYQKDPKEEEDCNLVVGWPTEFLELGQSEMGLRLGYGSSRLPNGPSASREELLLKIENTEGNRELSKGDKESWIEEKCKKLEVFNSFKCIPRELRKLISFVIQNLRWIISSKT